jgi:hypothetical protein
MVRLTVNVSTDLSFRPEESWAYGPPKVLKIAFGSETTFHRKVALPLSSRAQPRDLQFRGPFLEMFFD